MASGDIYSAAAQMPQGFYAEHGRAKGMMPELGASYAGGEPGAKTATDTGESISQRAADTIATEARLLASMCGGQRYNIAHLSAANIKLGKERDELRVMNANQATMINRQAATAIGLRKHIDAAEAQIVRVTTRLDAQDACIRTLNEQLAYARNVTGYRISATEFADLQRKAKALDIAVAALNTIAGNK